MKPIYWLVLVRKTGHGHVKSGWEHLVNDRVKILATEEERLAVFKAFYEVKFASAPSIYSDVVSTLIDTLPARDEPPEINLLAPTLKEVEMAVKCLSIEKILVLMKSCRVRRVLLLRAHTLDP